MHERCRAHNAGEVDRSPHHGLSGVARRHGVGSVVVLVRAGRATTVVSMHAVPGVLVPSRAVRGLVIGLVSILGIRVCRLSCTLLGRSTVDVVDFGERWVAVLAFVEVIDRVTVCLRPRVGRCEWCRAVRGSRCLWRFVRSAGCGAVRRWIRRESIATWRMPVHVGVEWRKPRSLVLLGDVLRLVILPGIQPRLKTVVSIWIDVQVIPDQLQPFNLEHVQLGHFDRRNIRPGSVDERVVVEKLAAEDERYRKQSIDLVLAGCDRIGQVGHAIVEVVKAEQDRGGREAGGRKHLLHPLPERWLALHAVVEASSQVNICQADGGVVVSIHGLSRLRNKVRHLLHVVIELGGHSTGRLLFLCCLPLPLPCRCTLLFLLDASVIVVGEGYAVLYSEWR